MLDPWERVTLALILGFCFAIGWALASWYATRAAWCH